ncbi:MAG: hypothetical protein A2X67_10465 [Ignavibacteria bacterium GWA2_55_11]|nr:MAG: hypothetical protein A2X67_10465 [Ignavibacteria bacterium GWA2_55_11]OGU47905.1 MAG: hypothetical protein A2X68_07195 [Ignavibacteria bacterium GWC2_56_12]OGU65103.1 MAG: hypothetical protein A3C56_11510 [Ignavibacteria bacterium RIFCSPHIGHO2_02_FULL_56_12]OGU71746.1 MAG: hypothetical protein A3H45_04275 [Ignavibacteria bacterium RIFCSPLOWO2_02_FULL_55_14]HAV24459.1 DUF2721 domain-containing protein [Bacteroidota bacterium]
MNEQFSITQIIQLILAPAVMINATGLLLLTVSNKYSLILNRIRLLNEEKRRLAKRAAETSFSTDDNQRLESVLRQVGELTRRSRMVRNANVCYFSAIGIFVATSLALGVDLILTAIDLQPFLLTVFLLGMTVDLIGVVYSGLDTLRAYAVVKFEVEAD